MKNTFLDFAMPKFPLLEVFFEKPILALGAITPAVAVSVSNVVSFEGVAWTCFWMFFADLITGLLASYFEWRDSEHKDKWFFGKGEGFSSDKFKKMIFKGIAYLLLPFLLIRFQSLLKIKTFKYETLSDAEFELATIFVILFCLNEGFSIFHENLPKCGFNLWASVKKMIGFYKEAKKEITE